MKKDLHRSRDRLMWVLLQYISGSIQRNSVSIVHIMFNLKYTWNIKHYSYINFFMYFSLKIFCQC